MTRTLFDIGDDLRALANLMDECDADALSPEVDAALSHWFAELAADEGRKLDGYVGLIRTFEMEASAAKAEAEQYAMKARTRENRIARLKDRLKGYLEATGRKKVETETKRVLAIQANGGVQKLSIVSGVKPEDVPPEFQKVTVEIDTNRVREALSGTDPLAIDFAWLEPRGTSLRIR